ncbi:MAG TPA: acetoacetate decarboxylase family protein [Microthrixaceae bacterium]|nr:acetoacetate decarboxylase family protein [Microthrixaceae bacterium]
MAGLTAEADGSYIVDGKRVAMPVEVRAAQQAAATFLVRHAAAQQLIEHTGLRATRQRGGKAIVSLAIIDYTDNDLGSYGELALAFVVDDPGSTAGSATNPKAVNTLIHRLPVTEAFTCAAGRGIWGFPKWIADLTVGFSARGASCALRADGHDVVSITLRRGIIPLPRRPMDMNAFTCDEDGIVRRTPWSTHSRGRQTVRPGGATVEIGYGHPMADELRTLGLPKRALLTVFDDHMSATFGVPEVVTTGRSTILA